MYKARKDGIIIGVSDERPVAVFTDSFATALGEEAQADIVILRLYHADWRQDGPLVPLQQLHQFALPARRAAELGRQLLELAAQAEKETDHPPEH
jgi:hypothetical protein